MQFRVLFPLTVLLTATASHSFAGPSFDCAKASTVSEYTICGDAGLSDLDVELAAAYKRALAASSDPAFLKSRQKAWVSQREQCGSTDCIRSLYIQRLSELEASMDAQSGSGQSVSSGSLELSDTFVVANALPPDDFLSLRTEPSAKSGSRIEKMPNGTVLKIIQRRGDGWWLVQNLSSGQQGWAKSGNGQKNWIVPNPAAAQALAAAQAKKAEEEKARLQAEADAEAAAKAKVDADAKAKAEADAKAKREADAKAVEEAAKTQALARISAVLGNPDPQDVFVFLNRGNDAPNLAKNLDGELVSSSGTIAVCHTSVTSGFTGEQNTRYTTNVENFLDKSLPVDAERSAVPLDFCGATTKPDAIYFQVQHLRDASSKFLNYLAENLAGSLTLASSYTRSQASADENAYQQKIKYQIAAAEQRSQEILQKVLAGTEEGYAILLLEGSTAPICFAADNVIDQKSIDDGSASVALIAWVNSDEAGAKSLAGRPFAAQKSADAIYIGLTKNKGECGAVFASYKVLAKFAAAMQRDDIKFKSSSIAIDPRKLADEIETAVRVKREEAKAVEIAKEAEDARKAEEQRRATETTAEEALQATDQRRKEIEAAKKLSLQQPLEGDRNCVLANQELIDLAVKLGWVTQDIEEQVTEPFCFRNGNGAQLVFDDERVLQYHSWNNMLQYFPHGMMVSNSLCYDTKLGNQFRSNKFMGNCDN